MLLKTSGLVGHKRAHPNLFELLAGASVAVADRRLDAWLRAFAVGLGARSIELCVDPAAMNRPKEGAMERAIGAHAILRILGLPAHRHRRMAAVLDAACLALADALERDRAHAMERLRNQVFSTACSRAGGARRTSTGTGWGTWSPVILRTARMSALGRASLVASKCLSRGTS